MVFLLAALTMIGPFTVDTIFPGFPAVQREFAVDAVATQQIVSVYLFTFAVMSLLHGPLSDALGRKPIIVGGLAPVSYTHLDVYKRQAGRGAPPLDPFDERHTRVGLGPSVRPDAIVALEDPRGCALKDHEVADPAGDGGDQLDR